MAITLVAEILITGFFTLLWLLLLVTTLFGSELVYLPLSDLAKNSKEYLIPAIVAGSYQLGWLLNGLTYKVEKKTFKKFTEEVYSSAKLESGMVRVYIYSKASTELKQDFDLDRSVIRLSRNGVLNFLCLSAVLPFYGARGLVFSGICFLISFASLLQFRDRYKRMHKRMAAAYNVLQQITGSSGSRV